MKKYVLTGLLIVTVLLGMTACSFEAEDEPTAVTTTAVTALTTTEMPPETTAIQVTTTTTATTETEKTTAATAVKTTKATVKSTTKAVVKTTKATTKKTEKKVVTTTRKAQTTVQKQVSEVYITDTGNKYHLSGCRCLKESKIPISLSEAKARGYGPCGICHPPQ